MGAPQFYKDEQTSHDHPGKAKVELPIILLEKLILSGVLSGNECKCLDDAARKTLWKSLLQGSQNREQSLCV